MSKITKYKMVFEGDVQKAIDEGWQPYGSPVANFYFSNNLGSTGFKQAMVRYAEEPDYQGAAKKLGKNLGIGSKSSPTNKRSEG